MKPLLATLARGEGRERRDGSAESYNFKQAPFNKARHGCGIAIVGREGTFQGELVTPKADFVARYAGDLRVGLNDTEPRNNEGYVTFGGSTHAPHSGGVAPLDEPGGQEQPVRRSRILTELL